MIEADFSLAYRDFSLQLVCTLPTQGVTAVFGTSGAGKSTLLRCLAGLTRPQGCLRIGNEVWQDDARNIFVPPHRRAIGMVFQDSALFPHLTVQGNLDFASRRAGKTEAHRQQHLLQMLGIDSLLQRWPDTLSGGEKQRVAIARALCSMPRLLLLDEPLASLDQARKAELLPYLENLQQELDIPAVFVSHSVQEVARLADHLLILDEGKLAASGSLVELFPRLDQSHGNEADVFTLLEGSIVGHADADHLSQVQVGQISLWVRQINKPVGSKVRLNLRAIDVSLALSAPVDSSVLNILPASVSMLSEISGGRMIVQLQLAGCAISARITRRSVQRLGLQPGTPVFAQIKAVAPLS